LAGERIAYGAGVKGAFIDIEIIIVPSREIRIVPSSECPL